MNGVADADVVLSCCAAVGHNMEVEPRRIPFLVVLKVVDIYLSFGYERNKHGRTKQHDSGAKPHWRYIFGKNSVFVLNASLLSAKNNVSYFINKVCSKNRLCCQCKEPHFFIKKKCFLQQTLLKTNLFWIIISLIYPNDIIYLRKNVFVMN